jgi:hypothetical protein
MKNTHQNQTNTKEEERTKEKKEGRTLRARKAKN